MRMPHRIAGAAAAAALGLVALSGTSAHAEDQTSAVEQTTVSDADRTKEDRTKEDRTKEDRTKEDRVEAARTKED